MSDSLLKFTCINCGSKIKELYKKYNSSVLKLVSCEKCQNIANKYVEYDPVIIMIDLVLLRKEAYRHMLFNMDFKSHWKLAIMIQIMEAYSEWILMMPRESIIKPNGKKVQSSLDDFNTGDLEFYQICANVTFKTACFISAIIILTTIYSALVKRTKVNQHTLFTVWKAMTISSFGIFLLLPSLIWDDNTVQEFHLTFVSLYLSLSQLLAYTVALDCPKLWSIFVILFAHYLKAFSLEICFSIYDTLMIIFINT